MRLRLLVFILRRDWDLPTRWCYTFQVRWLRQVRQPSLWSSCRSGNQVAVGERHTLLNAVFKELVNTAIIHWDSAEDKTDYAVYAHPYICHFRSYSVDTATTSIVACWFRHMVSLHYAPKLTLPLCASRLLRRLITDRLPPLKSLASPLQNFFGDQDETETSDFGSETETETFRTETKTFFSRL